MVLFEKAHRCRPPWDTGRPQGPFVAHEKTGELVGDVLDVGCGTGENALFLAAPGYVVWGVAAAPTPIEQSRKKAEERGSTATFLVHDALALPEPGRTLDTVVDSGQFHALSDPQCPLHAGSLAGMMRTGGSASCSPSAISSRETTAPGESRRRRSGRPAPTGRGSTGSGPYPSMPERCRRFPGLALLDHQDAVLRRQSPVLPQTVSRAPQAQ